MAAIAPAEPKRRVRDPEGTLSRLVEAARVVFGRRGFERATVEEIVAAAGCSKGAFYTHFDSKEEAFLLLLERRLAHNRQRFAEICPWRGDPAAWTRCLIETLVAFSREDAAWPALSVEFMAHGMRDERIGRRIAFLHEEWRRLIADVLRQGDMARYVAEPEVIATAVIGLIDGLIIQTSFDPHPSSATALGERIGPLLAAWFPADP